MSWMHCICWSIPLLLSFLPLSTNRYGADDEQDGNIPCDLNGSPSTKYIWLDTCLTGVAFFCFLLMAAWTCEIYIYCRKRSGGGGNLTAGNKLEREMSFLNIMKFYPLALLITWMPRFAITITITAKLVTLTEGASIASYFFIVSTQYGTLSAIIYFSSSPVSRMLWLRLLKRITSYFYFFENGEVLEDVGSDDQLICQDAADNDEDALVNQGITSTTTTTANTMVVTTIKMMRRSSGASPTVSGEFIENPLTIRLTDLYHREDSIFPQI
eukprot:gene37773-49481_t